ncbi:hypothetical protein ACP275_09G122700 [Erythranthe tilingii]
MASNNLRSTIVTVLLFAFVLSPTIPLSEAAAIVLQNRVISGAICPRGLCECCAPPPYETYFCTCCVC